MRLEATFLRSAVARRVFWVLLAAAALPVLLFAGLGYAALDNLLSSHDHRQTQLGTKYAALRVYDRLVAAQAALSTLSATGRPDAPVGHVPLAAREIFRGVATVPRQGAGSAGDAALATLWRELARDPADWREGSRRRLWWQPSRDGQPSRVVLAVRDRTHWWLGELAPGFLWSDLAEDGAGADLCVTDPRGTPLKCDAGRPDPRAAAAPVSFSLFMGGDFGAVDWVFARPLQVGVAWSGDLPLQRMAAQGGVLTLLLVGMLGLMLVRRTTVPLERLVDGTRRLSQRDWSVRVELQSGDEFAELARSFNEMAERVGRQVQAMQVQAAMDREILSGLDLARVMRQVGERLTTLLPSARALVLMAPPGPGRWQAFDGDGQAPREVSLEAPWLAAAATGGALHGVEAHRALSLMGQPDATGLDVVSHPVASNQRLQAVMLLALPRAQPLDAERRQELDELSDRLAVTLSAAARDRDLRQRAVHDSLTALLNRAGLIENLDALIARSESADFVLVFIDLDGFKEVNDAHGHHVGDDLLRHVAQLLRSLARGALAVARPGGDEFVLVLPGDRDAAEALARQVCDSLAEPQSVDGQRLHIGASIGLVHSPTHGRERIELMRRADMAMYAAKSAGRSRHAWFEPWMDERAAERAWLHVEMERGLRDGHFLVHYQPRVRAIDGSLASAEALVRWAHPERGMIGPNDFIQLAEDTGQIEMLGRFVMDEALGQLTRWRRQGATLARVAINVSALQLRNPGFADEVLALLHRHGLRGSDLEIELTESLFSGQTDAVTARLQPLRNAGVQVALDDFGTGYSSLASLYRLPVDVLKIDRAFVIDLGRREAADAVARSIVALARALGKHVVAEGVETDRQHGRLVELGCDELQGYLFARPLPPAQMLRLMIEGTQAEPA